MIAWAIAFAVYAVAAVISLAPVLIAAFGKVKLNPGGPAFEEASHFSPEAKQKLTHNYDRMRGTLGFWKQQATKYERLHLYCMLWIIILSAVTPVLTLAVPQYPNDPFARWILTAAALHISIITGMHKFFKVEVNFKAFRQGKSEFYDSYRRMLDNPGSFGQSEDDQLIQYFSQVSLIRKQVRNAETDTYAGLEELRQAQTRAPDITLPVQKSAGLEHVPPELNSVGFPGRSGWQILSALIRFWERERCRRPTLLIFEVE